MPAIPTSHMPIKNQKININPANIVKIAASLLLHLKNNADKAGIHIKI